VDDDLSRPETVKEQLRSMGHRANKDLGQNFLIDPNTVARIVEVAEVEGRNVVEIGAGTGALTRPLADIARSVVAYEVDASLEAALADTLAGTDNVEVRIDDATTVDLQASLVNGTWAMVANLPYNVGTPILLTALQEAPRIDRFVVLVQREVGDRLLAAPGSRTYGVPSVIAGLHATGHLAFTVSPTVFEPQPNVDSAVVVLDRMEPSPHAAAAVRIAKTAFNQRRKMIRSSLRDLAETAEWIEAAGVDPTTRAEQVSPVQYVDLAASLEAG